MDPATQLGKSLDSRRSSGNSKKSLPVIGGRPSTEAVSPGENADSKPNSNTATRGGSPAGVHKPSNLREIETSGNSVSAERVVEDEDGTNVRKNDLLWGP
jgi:autophagy-related protein 11